MSRQQAMLHTETDNKLYVTLQSTYSSMNLSFPFHSGIVQLWILFSTDNLSLNVSVNYASVNKTTKYTTTGDHICDVVDVHF